MTPRTIRRSPRKGRARTRRGSRTDRRHRDGAARVRLGSLCSRSDPPAVAPRTVPAEGCKFYASGCGRHRRVLPCRKSRAWGPHTTWSKDGFPRTGAVEAIGGWTTLRMVERYAHVDDAELTRAVRITHTHTETARTTAKARPKTPAAGHAAGSRSNGSGPEKPS